MVDEVTHWRHRLSIVGAYPPFVVVVGLWLGSGQRASKTQGESGTIHSLGESVLKMCVELYSEGKT